MKSQNFFRAMCGMVLLVSFISINQPAYASASSFDKLGRQINERNSPDFQNILQAQPSISLAITLQTITLGEMATVAVQLNNVPVEGFTSIEITCTYYPDLIEARDIVVADLFGADPVVAIRGPQYDRFIVAIAGSHGNKSMNSGTVMTFRFRGLQAGQSPIECQARVSTGGNVLTDLPSIGTSLSVLGVLPTPTLIQSPVTATPTPQPALCDKAEFVADVVTPPGTVVLPGSAVAKGWRLKNVGTCVWTPAYTWTFVSGDQMDANLSNTLVDNVFPGQEVEVFVSFIAPFVSGHYQSFWKMSNASGVQFGGGDSASDPFLLDIVASGPTVTPIPPDGTPGADWLGFANFTYGFTFRYPSQGIIADGRTDTFARIDLPFVQGTNLSEKYLEVIVAENANPCQSPLPTNQPSETIIINGISFLKQTGEEGAAGSVFQWVVYSTLRDNVCVSLDFILHSHNPGVFPTPPPVFDYDAESAVFRQIVETYSWLSQMSTATPGFETPLPNESPTPIFTATPSTSMFIRVTSPNGGEVLNVGSTYRITWDSTPDIDKIFIGYKSCNSCLDWIAFDIPHTGYYDWNVMVGHTVNTQFKIYIIGYDTGTPGSASDDSNDYITVLQPTPTLPTIVPGFLTGQVLASKPVTVSLYNSAYSLVISVIANTDGTFNFTAPTGSYTVAATASGFLGAQGSAMISGGNTDTKITISLLAGDIDGNDVIDQFDAMTIGMGYNTVIPAAADLNNDGIINVLDLELLAKNYRKTGPVGWQ